MSQTTQRSGRNLSQQVARVAGWPPLVDVVLGAACLGMWAAGTAVQVQTSEAWILNAWVSTLPTLATFGQVWDFITGHLAARQVVPFVFGWGVQLALIVASVGIELPP